MPNNIQLGMAWCVPKTKRRGDIYHPYYPDNEPNLFDEVPDEPYVNLHQLTDFRFYLLLRELCDDMGIDWDSFREWLRKRATEREFQK